MCAQTSSTTLLNGTRKGSIFPIKMRQRGGVGWGPCRTSPLARIQASQYIAQASMCVLRWVAAAEALGDLQFPQPRSWRILDRLPLRDERETYKVAW